MDFWEYLSHMGLNNLLYIVLCFVALYLTRGSTRMPDETTLKQVLKKRMEELGPMSTAEKRLLVLALISVLGFMLEPFTGLNAVWILCLAALLCYMPGMGILNVNTFNNLNIMFLVFVAGCMAIGAVAGVVDANKWAVASIMPYLQGLPPTISVVCSYVAGTVANFLLTPFAATVAFTPRLRRNSACRWESTRCLCSTPSSSASTSTSSPMKASCSSTCSPRAASPSGTFCPRSVCAPCLPACCSSWSGFRTGTI